MREGWVETTLGEVLDPITDRAGDGMFDLVLSVTEKRGIIPQTEVFKNRIATDDVSKYKVLKPGDISFNPYLLWCGAVGQWLGNRPGVVSPVYECFRVKPKHHPRYLGLVFESGYLVPYFNSTAIGSIERRRRTTVPVFNAAPLPLPPIEEQRRIVDVIESVDNYITALEARAEAARTARTALLHDLLSNPGPDWLEVPLGDVATSRLGKMLSKASKTGVDEYPYVRNSDVQWDELNLVDLNTMCFSQTEREEFSLKAGDVLICEGGEVGRTSVVEVDLPNIYFQKAIHRVRCGSRLLPRFLLRYMEFAASTGRLVDYSSAQTIQHLTGEKLRILPISLPSIDDQRRIIDEVDSFSDFESKIADVTDRARELRSALLSDLLSGNHEIPATYDRLLGAA